MNIVVKELIFDYESLADQVVTLNSFHTELLKVYQEMCFSPSLWQELKETKASPLNVLTSVKEDKTSLEVSLTDLKGKVSTAQAQFSHEPETSSLLNTIVHNCDVILSFLQNLDLDELETMFQGLD